jgi:uncharacterized protein with ParB-like and HNH nuclease domain
LLNDLLGSIDGEVSVEELDPYFLGSIVLIKGDKPEAQVVDGQQRLITLTILLVVLRELAHDEGMRRGLEGFLLEQGNILLGTPDRFRLTVRERDQEFFAHYIQARGGVKKVKDINAGLTDSQENFKQNALLFLNRLGGLADDQRQRLAQYVVLRCYLVLVWTPDLDSAYRIFSILNDRGLDLSHADILKAEIIGKIIPESLQGEYARKWEEAEERLGREAFKDLFAHVRMIYRKNKLRATVLKEFRESVVDKEAR